MTICADIIISDLARELSQLLQSGENWQIVLADVTRRELIRFTTPDDSYVAAPETDGIFTIRRPE